MIVLVVNCGSSSLKYQLVNMDNEEVMAKGVVEKIGLSDSLLTHKWNGQKKEIQQLKLENDYLKIARSIAPDRETLENSRRVIAKLMRDVDKCIEQLNE